MAGIRWLVFVAEARPGRLRAVAAGSGRKTGAAVVIHPHPQTATAMPRNQPRAHV